VIAPVRSLLVAGLLIAAACGSDESSYDVRSDVVQDSTTRDISVFAPDDDGPWPVVYAMHGLGGERVDMTELATRVASGGAVVFAPTYRTNITTEAGYVDTVRDIECGYRFARSIADDYGGDLDLPVTFVGWSLGATFAVEGGLDEEIDPAHQYVTCFDEVPRADIIVALSGCYYEHDGVPLDFDMSEFANDDARIILVAGTDDATCAAWQTEDAADALRAAGYEVDVVELDGANHPAPIFHDDSGGQWTLDADDPAGAQTVELILDAIGQTS
jgi:predicted esterase